MRRPSYPRQRDLGWLLRPGAWPAIAWASYAVLTVRRQMAHGVLRPSIPPCWSRGRSSALGTEAVLKRLSTTCLEAALIRQEWLLIHGDRREVVIGIPPEGFGLEPAHAWVEGLDTSSPARYVEIYRIQPRIR